MSCHDPQIKGHAAAGTMKMTQRYTAWPACSDHAARSPRTRDMRQQGLTGGDIGTIYRFYSPKRFILFND